MYLRACGTRYFVLSSEVNHTFRLYSGNAAICHFLIQKRIDLAGPKFILFEYIDSSQIRMLGLYEVESY